jgi:hypothetical protein
MKPLDPLTRSLLEDARADAPAPGAEGRVWETLSQRLHAPLPPTAAAASRATGLTTGVKAGTAAWAAPALKALVGVVALGGGALAVTQWHASDAKPTAVLEASTSPKPAPVAEPAPPQAEHGSSPLAPAEDPGAAAASQLAEEARLLAQAQQALGRGQPARALAQVNEHAARFPHGQLAQTRDAARVLALCALSRTREARRAQQQFLGDWPESPLASRVQRACSR